MVAALKSTNNPSRVKIRDLDIDHNLSSRALLEYYPAKLPTIGNSDVGPIPPGKYRIIYGDPP